MQARSAMERMSRERARRRQEQALHFGRTLLSGRRDRVDVPRAQPRRSRSRPAIRWPGPRRRRVELPRLGAGRAGALSTRSVQAREEEAPQGERTTPCCQARCSASSLSATPGSRGEETKKNPAPDSRPVTGFLLQAVLMISRQRPSVPAARPRRSWRSPAWPPGSDRDPWRSPRRPSR